MMQNPSVTGLRPRVPALPRPSLTPGAVPNPAPTASVPMPSAAKPADGMYNPATMPPAGVGAPAPQAPMPPALPQLPALPGVSVSSTNPNADLRGTTIAPTNDVNRFDLVQQRLDNYDKTALPQFQANVRGLVSKNAGQGRLGSGMLNTDLGNESLAAENARNSYFGNLLTDATQGTIADAANNRNELRTERGYQTGQEQSAFDRARQQVFDQDALTNSDFGRNLATAQFGYEGNPASLLAQLSSIMGGQGGQTAAGAGASGANSSTLDMLRQILAQAGESPTVPQVPIPPTPPVRG